MPLPDSPFKILPASFSSQSATSDYLECPRRYLYRYHLYGTGIVPKFSSIPLTTGSSIHAAIQDIATQFLATGPKNNVDLEHAVQLAKEIYTNEVRKRPLGSAHSKEDEEEQQYIFHEQLALTEALIRLWFLREWPKIVQYYDILAVEQEITFPLGKIIYQSKPDLILIHKENRDVINYSLKSVKMGGDRLEKSYKVQLQAITEPYATSIWLKDLSNKISEMRESLQDISFPTISTMSKGLSTIDKFLAKYDNLPLRSSATRFCYLIKGERKETQRGNGKWRTNNPFIYGLRKFSPGEIEYAWTWWYKNENNKSGFGRLGKGWEEFPVWENAEVGGVKGWIEMLEANRGIEGDIGDGHVIDKHILSQPDVFTNWGLIENRIKQLEETENKVKMDLDFIQDGSGIFYLEKFPQNTGSCFFPSYCDYLTICPNGNDFYKQHVADNPLSEEYGLFERRVSHHEEERLYIQRVAEDKLEEGEDIG